jgi:hypothetical protein
MPKGRKSRKRAASVIGKVLKVMRIAAAEEPENFPTKAGQGQRRAIAVARFSPERRAGAWR